MSFFLFKNKALIFKEIQTHTQHIYTQSEQRKINIQTKKWIQENFTRRCKKKKQNSNKQKQSAIENVIIKFLTFVNLYTQWKREKQTKCCSYTTNRCNREKRWLLFYFTHLILSIYLYEILFPSQIIIHQLCTNLIHKSLHLVTYCFRVCNYWTPNRVLGKSICLAFPCSTVPPLYYISKIFVSVLKECWPFCLHSPYWIWAIHLLAHTKTVASLRYSYIYKFDVFIILYLHTLPVIPNLTYLTCNLCVSFCLNSMRFWRISYVVVFISFKSSL